MNKPYFDPILQELRMKDDSVNMGESFQGVYSAVTAYTVGQTVSYSGLLYVCSQSGTGQQPDTATTYWTDITSKGDAGEQGVQGIQGLPGDGGASTSFGSDALYFDSDTNTGILRTSADNVALRTGGVDALSVDASQNAAFASNITVTGALTTTGLIDNTSGQMKFPAIQSASADSNTLDDYEEGEFIVSLAAGTSGSITLLVGADTMAYTKIGRVVTITGWLVVDSISSPLGSLTIAGLPFPCGALTESSERSAMTIHTTSLGVAPVGTVVAYTVTGSTSINVDDGGNSTNALSNTFANHIVAGTILIVSGSYFAA